MAIVIKSGLLDDPQVVELLVIHWTRARAEAAAGKSHALDLSQLKAPGIRFFSAWDGSTLLGTVAIKTLSLKHGEVKSMHTAEASRRRGVASALLRHVINTARADGKDRLSLETHPTPYYGASRALYQRHGFVECGPFGDYTADPASVFMTLELGGGESS